MKRLTHVHCVCSGSEPVVAKTLFWGPGGRGGGGGDSKLLVLFKGGTEKFYSSLWGTDVFSAYVSNFRSPPGGNK